MLQREHLSTLVDEFLGPFPQGVVVAGVTVVTTGTSFAPSLPFTFTLALALAFALAFAFALLLLSLPLLHHHLERPVLHAK